MPQGSYKLSMLERDLPVHVANIERWGGRGVINGSGVGAEPRMMAKKLWMWLEWKEDTTILGDGERRTEPYFSPCLQASSGKLSAR